MNHNPLDLPAGGNTAEKHKDFSFDLDERIIETLAKECDVNKLIAEFAGEIKGDKDIEAVSKKIFEDYGRNWMKRTLDLSDKYPDRTYEILKAAAEKTGALTFPHIPLISMSMINSAASDSGIVQSFHPGLLKAIVSKRPFIFISPINPNLLPVNFSATDKQVLANASSESLSMAPLKI